MADAEDKAKAEKLAAAKKRVAQLQKQKAKKGGKGAKKAQAEASKEAAVAEPSPAADETKEEDAPEAPAETEEQAEEQQESKDEPPREGSTEPMPEVPPSEEPEASTSPKGRSPDQLPSRGHHGRQPSLSLQSKMRSSSFRRTSTSQPGGAAPPPSSTAKSPSLPPLSPEGDSVPDLFRKQAQRLEEMEKENKRLEKEVEDLSARWKKSEEMLEDLRDASGDAVELRDRLERAEKKAEEVENLKAEITALQRQNSHLRTKSHRPSNSVAVSGSSESSPALQAELDSKTSTIEAMEMEISNLRARLNSESSNSSAHQEQISALEDKLARSEAALEKSQRELADTKQSLSRAAEKAVKEGVDKTSTETLIKSLERQVQEMQDAKAEADKKIDTLEKKLQALGNLHKESETRNQTRLKERDKFEKDAVTLKKKLITIENENLRLREERDRLRKRGTEHTGNEEGLDELEDEERKRLERQVRELEGEVFDLKRGIWKERKRELAEEHGGEGHDDTASPSSPYYGGGGNAFDDVDLVGGLPSDSAHSRRRSMAGKQQPRHSSFTTVLSSGLAAFTGGTDNNRSRAGSAHSRGAGYPNPRTSLEHLSEKASDGGFVEDEDEMFDEEAFARAQAEEEARKRVEWAREVKRKLKDWQGWRLDLVECRYGAQGAGLSMGEIFEV